MWRIKIFCLVVLSASAVVSILDPNYTEKTKIYRLNPHIAQELQRSHHHHSGNNPRLSTFSPYQASSSSSSSISGSGSGSGSSIEQHERHANHDRKDYANNLDENYSGCPSGYTGVLPYPYDCRRFLNCWKGRAYIQTCGPGTVFNGDTLECDNPNKVVCRGLSAKLFDQQPTNNRLGKLQQYNGDGDNGDISCPIGYSGLLPHPNDCSKFLNCAHGMMHIQTCGPRTMFDARMKVCDFATKVDCTGRWGSGGYLTSASPSPELWNGNRGGKNFELTTSQNQLNQPPVKGWQHNHNHHHHHHNHQHGFYPEIQHQHGQSNVGASFPHHNHNCTNRAHNHNQQNPSPQSPIFFRDRWVSMNRTRPGTPTTKTPSTLWTPVPSQQPSSWRPIPSESSWFNRGSPGQPTSTTTTPTPTPTPSNYPKVFYGSTLTPGTDTVIYYAQPVDNDQPSEEVFTNVVGGDVSEISLPTNRKNVFLPSPESHQPSDPSMEPINIPNINLMPPHRTFQSDDRQFEVSDQGFASSTTPQPSLRRPNSISGSPNRPSLKPFSQNPQDDSMDAIMIPNVNLMPPHRTFTPDDRQFQINDQDSVSSTTPLIPRRNPTPLTPFGRPSQEPSRSFDDDRQSEIPEQFSPNPQHPGFDINLRNNIPGSEITKTPSWVDNDLDYTDENPSFTLPNSRFAPKPESRDSVGQTTPSWPHQSSYSPGSSQNPWIPVDESNLFGGMLPPPPPSPDSDTPSSINAFRPTVIPSRFPISTTTTKAPSHFNTNVRVFQIYPPPAVQNATTKIHPSPFYSPSYSGVAHSRNTSWPSIKTAPPNRSTPSPRPTPKTTQPPSPDDNFQPDIVFSHDGGVVVASHQMSPTTTQRHGLSPPNYNREFYKPTTPMSVQRAAPLASDKIDTEEMPISEAIKLLLRPYINRSGTVTDDMVSNAESHIMNLSLNPTPTTTSTSTSTTTTTTTIRTPTTPDSIDKDVEIVFAGEQNSLSSTFVPPPPLQSHHNHLHNPVQQNSPSKYHERHDRHFHQMHPHLPNPFGNELDADDYQKSDKDGSRNGPTSIPVDTASSSPAADVCEFDCGDGQCVKTFETCDGINHCANKKDEEQCSHLGYEIRLSNEGYGRVEVKILGQWGYVCDDKFGILDANVVCRELGYQLGASEVHGNSFYPPTDTGEVAFIMDEVDCSGNETSLKDCRFMGWGVSDCTPDEVVGVQCKTPVMTCPNDYWLCRSSKECIPPAFVCDNVPDCSDKSDESTEVCNSTVEFQLKGSSLKYEGRLEVLYRGVWGTVCDDDFGQIEAQVACNSLGYYGPAKIVKNAFGPGTGPIWLDQLSCYGNETTLDMCNHWSWGEHNCNHTEDVSLKCTPGAAPRTTKTPKSKQRETSGEDFQTSDSEDIGLDLYPMERSSKFLNSRKICGRFNANLTDEIPRELERVVKGNIAKRGHHPWQATIRTKGRGGISSHWCGAVLISKKHLLTAAHCLVGYPKGAYFIRLGDHYANIAESSEIDSYIENWYIHEKFREGTHMNNDIAVIVMKNPVRFNDYIQPICLPPEGTEYKEGRRCTISGWGSIQSGVSTPSNNLRVAQIPVISDEVCKLPHVYGSSVTEGMFCAGFLEEGVDACEGDSGGPFVCSDSDAETLYGIISWGQQCGHANKPGVYVKVEKYLDWIYEKIRFSMQKSD